MAFIHIKLTIMVDNLIQICYTICRELRLQGFKRTPLQLSKSTLKGRCYEDLSV